MGLATEPLGGVGCGEVARAFARHVTHRRMSFRPGRLMAVTCLTVHPRRSLRLGKPARELAFHSSSAKRRNQVVMSSRQIGQRLSQLRAPYPRCSGYATLGRRLRGPRRLAAGEGGRTVCRRCVAEAA